MGLDMYLERFPRYKDYGPDNIRAVEAYCEWEAECSDKECSFEEWTGYKDEDLPKSLDMEYLKGLIATRYWDWDEEHQFPHERICDDVAYWRKANAIHKWFVDHIQYGEDDCGYHREVEREDIIALIEYCKYVLETAVLIKGKVKNGSRLNANGKWEPIYQDGYLVANPQDCASVLPVYDGPYFGSQEYNESYLDDIKYTFEKLSKVLAETDFETQMLYYRSSW